MGNSQLQHWSLAELPWDRFDPGAVHADILKIVKAAALVEYNGRDYARYLCNVFPGDRDFHALAGRWADEEVQHGAALGAWAQKADPEWDFLSAVQRFRDGYKINLDVQQSVRGSRCGELIARCIVETGTSSFYKALGDAVSEPVLKQICRHIEQDELRHYKLFYSTLRGYLEKENLGTVARLKVGISRLGESEDDELAYAYYAANMAPTTPYNRQQCAMAYLSRAYTHYRAVHLERVVAMIMKACGIKPHGWLQSGLKGLAWVLMQSRIRAAQAALAAA